MKNNQLEDLFNMPTSGAFDQVDVEGEDQKVMEEIHLSENTLTTIEKVNQALPVVKGLDQSDKELDDLAQKATDAFTELFDYGQNVDSRVAGEILSQASSFLGHAITARTAKMNKKLKMIDMQLKKMRLDQTETSKQDQESSSGTILDRNELLKHILSEQSD